MGSAAVPQRDAHAAPPEMASQCPMFGNVRMSRDEPSRLLARRAKPSLEISLDFFHSPVEPVLRRCSQCSKDEKFFTDYIAILRGEFCLI